MLFTKEITAITYQDVVEFCNQQIPESINLDYKRDFPKNLEKTISAFANTTGGLIVIGVEDKDSKPKLPTKGIKYQKGFREKVNNIILSNIYPPVFPEIQVCESVKNKTFVVIRVPESHTVPHYIRHKTEVYIRTDDITKPERLAQKEEIEWLLDKRKKSEDFREFLIQESEDYFYGTSRLASIDIEDISKYFGVISLRILPLFPRDTFIDYKDLDNIKNEIAVGRGTQFPYFINRGTPIQNGIHHLELRKPLKEEESPHGLPFQYFQLNTFGLYLYKEDIGDFRELLKEGQKEKVINYYSIAETIHYFLTSASKFYQKLGFWGVLLFQVEMKGVLGVIIPHPLKNSLHLRDEQKFLHIPKEKFKWERKLSAVKLKDDVTSFSVDVLRDIAWSFGIEFIDEKRVREVLEKNFKL